MARTNISPRVWDVFRIKKRYDRGTSPMFVVLKVDRRRHEMKVMDFTESGTSKVRVFADDPKWKRINAFWLRQNRVER